MNRQTNITIARARNCPEVTILYTIFCLPIFLYFCIFIFLYFYLLVYLSFLSFLCFSLLVFCCIFVFLSFCPDITLIKCLKSLKSHSLCQNSKVAVSHSPRSGIELPGQLKIAIENKNKQKGCLTMFLTDIQPFGSSHSLQWSRNH